MPLDYKGSSKPFFYQQIVQNECIYRSRFYGIEWLALHDIDDYFHTILPCESNSSSPMLVQVTKSIANASLIGGLVFRNLIYGQQKDANRSNLLLDYVDHEPQYMEGGHEKILAQPENVDYFPVHMITVGKRMAALDPTNKGYHHHYNVTIDTSLQDTFATKVREVTSADYG